MAYRIEPNGDIVISQFEQGIGASPYSGLTDLKSVNISSVPGEAAVNFATQSVTQAPSYSGITATAFGDGFGLVLTGLNAQSFIEIGQAVTFTNSTITGVVNGTLYYVVVAIKESGTSQNIILGTTYHDLTQHGIGNTGTATLATVDPGRPKFFTSMGNGQANTNFMLDANGRVWSDFVTTTGGTSITATSSWIYTGNTLASDSKGNGMVYWRTANGTRVGDWDGWLFVFRDGFIDYSNVNGQTNGTPYNHVGTYTYGWNPKDGSTANVTGYLSGQNISGCPHNAIVGPDGNVYFCDYNTMGKIQQFNIVSPVTNFAPGTTSTYIYTKANNLPIQEVATCIAPLGTNYIIGGSFNQAYIWNGVDPLTITQPILLAEAYVSQIVTVNTNAYIFCGNRGNIYLTNGSQASFWAKVPDHISNTVEPYFAWGGAVYQKGKLYFGVYATDNSGQVISGYGGVWAVDTNTGAIWLSHELSYASYLGYASALYSIPPTPVYPTGIPVDPAGSGLFVGWYNGSIYGIDQTVSTPYTGGQSYIISDMIPIGTFLRPTTSRQIEFKVAKPLVSGESVQLLMGSYLGDSFTSVGTTSGDGTNTVLSGNFPITVQGQQWLLVKAILTGTASSPSYNRITELRVIGAIQKK